MNITEIAEHATTLAAFARASGFVVTIEQVSMQPPAMGQHVDVVSVREVRACAPVIKRCAGPNCKSTDGSSHSPECQALHQQAGSEAATHKPAHGGRNG